MNDRPTLPHGFTVRLLAGVRRHDAGRLLVGGSPLRVMRLSDTALRLLDGDTLTVTDPRTALLARRLLDANVAHPELQTSELPHPHELTVVIPVRDRPQQLARALEALGPEARVIVVDDGSDQPQHIAAVARGAGAQLFSLPRNRGPAAARNAGLHLVTTPYVAFVDSDVHVSVRHLQHLTRHLADPAVALVGPRIEGRATSTRPRWFERYEATASSLTLGHTPSLVRPGAKVGWLPSACLVARTSALGSGFDERMRIGEDVDLVLRLVKTGEDVRYDPAVVVHHDTRATITTWLGRKYTYGTSGAALAQRHPGAIAPAVLTPTMAITALTLMTRRRWGIALAIAGYLRTRNKLLRTLPDQHAAPLLPESLAFRGLGSALSQESALAVRHWWPIVGLLLPTRIGRRILTSALLIDSAVALEERRPRRIAEVAETMLGRRLDDLAYGAGLWAGAIRTRSISCLIVQAPGRAVPREGRTHQPTSLTSATGRSHGHAWLSEIR